ncbi:hypothetical protein AXF21_06950 [Eubacterium minutum ATCC 700079]|nr:hypothetical protein AXF21_06950 [Eubacterium minutum ATCC 700079]
MYRNSNNTMRVILMVMLISGVFFSVTFIGINAYDNDNFNLNTHELSRIKMERLRFDAPENKENLRIVIDKMRQIVCVINTERGAFTVGVMIGEKRQNDFKSIREELERVLTKLSRKTKLNCKMEKTRVLYYEIYRDRDMSDIKKRLAKVQSIEDVYNAKATNESIKSIEKRTVADSTRKNKTSYPYRINSFFHVRRGFPGPKWWNQRRLKLEQCYSTPTSPHAGDGNIRYKKKNETIQKGSGVKFREPINYNWMPNYINATATQMHMQVLLTCVAIEFKYNNTNLRNLNHDENEAIELQMLFYNYKNDPYNTRGYSFLPPEKEMKSWYSTFPNAYLDTNFGDNQNEISCCVGCSDTRGIRANVKYFWAIDFWGIVKPKGYPQDGRCKVQAQRSYRRFWDGPFSVFAEEHERIRNIGLPKGKNWFSESAYSKKRYSPPHKSYFYYGEWEFDPLKEELIQ